MFIDELKRVQEYILSNVSQSALLGKLAENTYHTKTNLPAVVFVLFCFAFERSTVKLLSHSHKNSHDSRSTCKSISFNMIAVVFL